MTTLSPQRGDNTDDQARKDVGVVKATYLMAGSGTSLILILTVLSGCGEIGATATGAIAAVGTITTAAFGVAAVYLRRRRH